MVRFIVIPQGKVYLLFLIGGWNCSCPVPIGRYKIRFLLAKKISYHVSPLKSLCQKSLPFSLFQREESFSTSGGGFLPLFPPLEKGSCEKIQIQRAGSLSRCPGEGQIQAAKTGGRWRAAKHLPDFRRVTLPTWEYSCKNIKDSLFGSSELNTPPATEKPAPFLGA